MSISIHPGTHSGTLMLNGDMTEDVALQFDAGLDLLCGYYHFDQIALEINSAGGQISALEHMLAGIERWRALGRQVSTRSRWRAGSAAAMLLSCGDVGSRFVSASTTLVFHSARVDGKNVTFTADAAARLGALLQGTDQIQVGRIIEHQLHGFGNWKALAAEGTRRCEQLHLSNSAGKRSSMSTEDRSVGLVGVRQLRAVSRALVQCLARQSVEPYRRLLMSRFNEDRAMLPAEAWAMCLIDGVTNDPRMQPRNHLGHGAADALGDLAFAQPRQRP